MNLDAVENAEVSLDEGLARIQLKPDETLTREQVTEALESAGYKTGNFKTIPDEDQESRN